MPVPATMRAAVMRATSVPLTFEEIPVPTISDDEMLMEVKACGVCHTDATVWGMIPIPEGGHLILGHEGAGVVAAVGKNVTDFKVGDRILSPMHSGGCGTCHYCSVKGVETQCAKKAWHAISRNGFFAEYCAVNPKNTVKIPEGVSFAQAGPIGCAGVTVYNALRKSGVRAGEWVGISGAGGLGQLAIQIAKTKGMKVLVLDVDDAKLETAKQLGADAVVNPRTEGEQTAEKVKAATDSGEGLDGVVVVTNANSAFESAPNFVRGAATVVFIGVPTAAIKIDPYAVLSKEMKIVGSFLGSRDDADEALTLVAEGKVKPIVTECKLDDLNNIFHEMDHGAGVANRMVVTQFR